MVFPLEEVGFVNTTGLRDKPLDKSEMGDYHSRFDEDSSLLRSDIV
jgi:hypothetical protein